mmetsp:Transcript_10990/g.26513  ORF Transcript_10990/g.26513 Transcript_10990/m.26513 type:complete len:219 (+) Transcript_10990:561-1217(+)
MLASNDDRKIDRNAFRLFLCTKSGSQCTRSTPSTTQAQPTRTLRSSSTKRQDSAISRKCGKNKPIAACEATGNECSWLQALLLVSLHTGISCCRFSSGSTSVFVCRWWSSTCSCHQTSRGKPKKPSTTDFAYTYCTLGSCGRMLPCMASCAAPVRTNREMRFKTHATGEKERNEIWYHVLVNMTMLKLTFARMGTLAWRGFFTPKSCSFSRTRDLRVM